MQDAKSKLHLLVQKHNWIITPKKQLPSVRCAFASRSNC